MLFCHLVSSPIDCLIFNWTFEDIMPLPSFLQVSVDTSAVIFFYLPVFISKLFCLHAYRVFLICVFCEFYYVMSQSQSAFFFFIFNGSSLWLIDADVCFLHHLVEIFHSNALRQTSPIVSPCLLLLGLLWKEFYYTLWSCWFPMYTFVMQYFNFPLLSCFISHKILSSMSLTHSSASFCLEFIISIQVHISVTAF